MLSAYSVNLDTQPSKTGYVIPNQDASKFTNWTITLSAEVTSTFTFSFRYRDNTNTLVTRALMRTVTVEAGKPLVLRNIVLANIYTLIFVQNSGSITVHAQGFDYVYATMADIKPFSAMLTVTTGAYNSWVPPASSTTGYAVFDVILTPETGTPIVDIYVGPDAAPQAYNTYRLGVPLATTRYGRCTRIMTKVNERIIVRSTSGTTNLYFYGWWFSKI